MYRVSRSKIAIHKKANAMEEKSNYQKRSQIKELVKSMSHPEIAIIASRNILRNEKVSLLWFYQDAFTVVFKLALNYYIYHKIRCTNF